MDYQYQSLKLKDTKIVKSNFGYEAVKRSFDFLFSLILIICLSWLLIILMLIVVFTSKGKPIYLDDRIGKGFRVFSAYKIRTMYRDAETNPEKYCNEEQLKQWKAERKIENDPRVTKIGRILRKTSLDELPQLFNILKGDMSFVGPRPITYCELSMYFTEKQAIKLLSVKPGLTGNWAVNGRNEVTFSSKQRQKLELAYVDNASLSFDIKLLFYTIPAVLSLNGDLQNKDKIN